ncbi:hypothetical protein ACFGVS_20190 [Mucilaginibacter sp. AW1-7]|uniref:hypothetical protein n=1 Tax=Mucilaginibacter sp. AW1-7 TaxID=3349874 RepID=UPI003F734E97
MKSRLLISVLFLIATACCGKKSAPAPVPDFTPGKATLTLPKQNEACTSGTIISATQSSVLFTWGTSNNADSYDLNLKNLLTGATTSQTTSTTQLQITLFRNTPYSWYIVSKSSKSATTVQSDTWKFYNAGAGTVSYAPYPADVVAPAIGQNVAAPTGTVNLSWKGSSVGGNITGYDVYFGTGTSPGVLKSNVIDNFYNNVSVISGLQYYWKIVTKDVNGNTSDSGLFQFKVN